MWPRIPRNSIIGTASLFLHLQYLLSWTLVARYGRSVVVKPTLDVQPYWILLSLISSLFINFISTVGLWVFWKFILQYRNWGRYKTEYPLTNYYKRLDFYRQWEINLYRYIENENQLSTYIKILRIFQKITSLQNLLQYAQSVKHKVFI